MNKQIRLLKRCQLFTRCQTRYLLSQALILSLMVLMLTVRSVPVMAYSPQPPNAFVSLESPIVIDQQGLISISAEQMPVREILKSIADHKQLNMLISNRIDGVLNLRLERVTWQQALEVIIAMKHLQLETLGDVMLITPSSASAHPQGLSKGAQSVAQDATSTVEPPALFDPPLPTAPLTTDVVAIHYAQAEEIAALLRHSGRLSSLGVISVDRRTNALVLHDEAQNIDAMRALIRKLDVAMKQVRIEARIVIINEGDLQDLGVRWGLSRQGGQFSTSGSIEGHEPDSALEDRLNINLPATTPNAASMAFRVASLGKQTLLDLELSALQQESRAEIISSPRLLTTNNKVAYIEQGTEIPYLESSLSGASSVAFKKAVLSLEVTPQITPNNRLLLDLTMSQDRPGQVVKTGTGEAVAIDTQRIATQVLVNDGETIVLGGIFQHSVLTSTNKVPLLADIPVVGTLFQRNYDNITKSELVIFVTPNVIIEQ